MNSRDSEITHEEADPLCKELAELRQRSLANLGGRNREPLALPNLGRIANAAFPEVSNEMDRIRDTLRAAANRLGGGDYSAAICAWWGVDDTLGWSHLRRREQAAEYLHITLEAFDRDHRISITENLATQLWALYEETQTDGQTDPSPPVEQIRPEPATQTGEHGADSEATQKTPSSRLPRLVWGLMVGAVVLVAIGLTLGASGVGLPLVGSSGSDPLAENRQPPPLPPPGSIVNARTGKVEAAQIERPVPDGVRIESGEILRVCNLPSDDPCFLTGLQPPIPVRGDDTLEFRVRLHNPSTRPLPKFHVSVSFREGSKHPQRDFISLFVVWESGFLTPVKGTNLVEVAFPSKINRLTYVHGSTKLLDGNENLVGRLPNGIVGDQGNAGLWLNELGPPRSCSTCNPKKYVRYISFKAEVE